MEPLNALSLDDLGAVLVVVPILRPDERTVHIRLRTLTEDELWNLRRKIEWPKPPAKDMTKTGPVYDYQDKGYQDAIVAAERRLANLMLLDSLPFVIAGESDDERLATLQVKVGGYAHTQLIEAVNRINTVSKEQIADMARSFRAEGTASAPDDAEARPDAEPVA